MIKKLLFVFSIVASGAFAQQPNNIGFESGNTTNWICGSGTFGKKSIDSCIHPLTFIVNYTGKCLDEDGINASNTPSTPFLDRHIVMSSGTDPNSFNSVPCVAPANLFPDNANTYSFRLGNSITNINPKAPDSLALTEGMKFKLQVDASNKWLTYLYAVFINDPIVLHPVAESAQFKVKITDANDSIISYLGIRGGDKTLVTGKDEAAGQWKFSNWRKVKVNLSAFIGQTVSIEFSTGDCYPSQTSLPSNYECLSLPGSHAAYAYLDLYCESVVSDVPFLDENNIAVDVYPNPFNTELNISISGLSTNYSSDLKMYNYLGQEVKSQSLKNGVQKISRDNLPNGIYLLEIVDQGKVIGKKKVVIND